MRNRSEWRAALSMLGAMAGMGFATGREPALFFTQFKVAAWMGLLTASVVFGLLVAGVVRRGVNPPVGDGLSRICEALRLLLASLVAAIMLARLGRTGAMTLPLRYGYAVGVLLGLLAALALAGMKDRWGMGFIIVGFAGIFCAANAVDPRPAQVYTTALVEFKMAGDIGMAILLAIVYAALNACVAAWGIANLQYGTLRPVGLGVKAAFLLCAVLITANLALLRGGNVIIAHPMPWVALSARWGITGFWFCAGMQALCAAATLSAALNLLLGRLFTGSRSRGSALCAIAVGAILFGVLSFGQ